MYPRSRKGKFVTKKRADRVKGVKMSQAHKCMLDTVLFDHDYAIFSDCSPATHSDGDNTVDFTDRDVLSDNNHVTDNNINVNRPELGNITATKGTSTVMLDPELLQI